MEKRTQITLPDFPAVFRATEHPGDAALLLRIKNLRSEAAYIFFTDLQSAIERAAWGITTAFIEGTMFDGKPHIVRVATDTTIGIPCKKFREWTIDGRLSFPLPVALYWQMRRQAGLPKLQPKAPPPELFDDFMFVPSSVLRHSIMFDKRSPQDIFEQLHPFQLLAESLSFLDEDKVDSRLLDDLDKLANREISVELIQRAREVWSCPDSKVTAADREFMKILDHEGFK